MAEVAQNRLGSKNGFTVLEVMFVLAIAGIILMLVLQAIPMLMRNSRNNRRKQDVSVVLEAISHWELNNSGDMPSWPTDNFMQYSASKLSYYDTSNLTVTAGDPHNTLYYKPGITNVDALEVHNYAKCDPATPGGYTNNDSGYNDVVALYAIETGGGSQPKCQEL